MRRSIGAVQAAAMLLAGILIGQKLHPSLLLSLILLAVSLAGGVFFYLRGREYTLDHLPMMISRGFLCIALLSLGLCRIAWDISPVQTGSIENFAGSESIQFTGHIIAPPTQTASRTTLRVEIDTDQAEPGFPDSGKLLLVFYSRPDVTFHYGDRLEISGKVILPPDTGSSFSYRDYLARDGITAMINNPHLTVLPGFSGDPLLAQIYRLRETLTVQVYRLFSAPESALMAGILLGDESKIPSGVEHAFQKTSTAHIIAISGANFTLLTWLLLGVLRRIFPQWWAPLLMLPSIGFYTVLVGGNAAVVRAAIMCVLTICGSVIGRSGNGINNLALTAAIMGFIRPAWVFDLGFQLSVTATLGILLFSEPLCRLVRGLLAKLFPNISEAALTSLVNVLNDLCLLSISAQIFTMWISAQAFGRISLISLPANMLIAPFQPLIMLGGFAALILSFIFYPLGAAAAWLVWAAPALTIRIVERCAEARWGAVYFDLSSVQAWLIIGLILAVWLGRNRLIRSIRSRNFMPYAVLLSAFAAIMIWVNVLDRIDRKTQIDFRQTASAMTLKVLSPASRLFIIADGLTNYAAQEVLETQLLPVPRTPEAAWIDLSDSWMEKEFLKSNAGNGLSVLYLNRKSQQNRENIPMMLSPGFVFSADGIELQLAVSYLGKKAWIVRADGQVLLFPNGIVPERLFQPDGISIQDPDLIILGKRDNTGGWADFCESGNHCPTLFNAADRTETTFTISEGNINFR